MHVIPFLEVLLAAISAIAAIFANAKILSGNRGSAGLLFSIMAAVAAAVLLFFLVYRT